MEEVVGSIPTRSTKPLRSVKGTPAWTNRLNSRTWTLGSGLSGTVRHFNSGTTQRATAEKLEISSVHSGTDQWIAIVPLSAPRRSRGGRRFDPDQVHQILILCSSFMFFRVKLPRDSTSGAPQTLTLG